MRLKVVFEPSDEGGYTVYVPSLPGSISEGDTLDEARRNILEAIQLDLESDESDQGLVEGNDVIVEEVTV